jgi:hypothetical protein
MYYMNNGKKEQVIDHADSYHTIKSSYNFSNLLLIVLVVISIFLVIFMLRKFYLMKKVK